ncbi:MULTISPECIES: PP2C family protein-serine/threonine phosphatase [unclassified Pseudofrankia]|uniref:PP2C family protein-serine/threonine phosphatase n=1 Tax=unclassified Pseudofrankia TaxID=2994372 RepID=UPI0008DA8B66|nr:MULTISPECIES: GAF domain-containing SpoIIE family protein phosphatase [unclassified Pseudofrankia]MDT3442454.1 SpoIIE family protein phosphatase [Pseudofrankia sp. BMG5.37]OHV48986.1 protein serine phosphatase [Pseudofrankia sp. BMG5.36]
MGNLGRAKRPATEDRPVLGDPVGDVAAPRRDAPVARARPPTADELISSLSQALVRSRRLLAATSALGTVLTVDDVADVAFRTAAADAAVTFAGFVLFGEDDSPDRVLAWPRLTTPVFTDVWVRARNPGPAATGEVVRTGQPRFDPTRVGYLNDYPDRRAVFAAIGIDASATLPLTVSGRIIGVLSLAWSGPRSFNEEERAYLRTLAGVYAQAIERARLHERQRSVVETLQRAILPRTLPELPGMELVARYLPAGRDVEVGGDWYDAVVRPDGSVTLVVGDVGGHGLPAVSAMAELRHAARAYAIEGRAPAAITTRLSAHLLAAQDDTLATAIVATVEPNTGRLTWSCAGHPPPLLLTSTDARYLDDVHGPMLGVVPGYDYGQRTMTLPPASSLLLYSDGLVERRGTSLTDRLATLAAAAAQGPNADAPGLDALCDRLLADVAGPSTREDDLCLLAVRGS